MKKTHKIFLSILIIFFIILLVLVKLEKTINIDTNIYNFIIKIKSDELTNIVKAITNLGGTFIIITIIVLSFLLLKNKIYQKLITVNIIGIVLLNQILKHLIMRQRPDQLWHLVEESGFSFPSGHSMAAFGFYGYFIYLINISKINKKLKIFLTIFLSILILLIGLSRVYLGVHYLSDVVAGFIVSLIYLIIFITITQKYLINE